MTTPDVDLDALKRQFGASTVDRYFDDDGDGVADTAIVSEFCRMATAGVRDRLHVYGDAVLDSLRDHERYTRLLAVVVMGERAMSRQEWMLPTGRWPYEVQKIEAFAELDKIAKSMVRLAPELTSGVSRQTVSARRPATRELTWAPTNAKPTRGGF